MIGADTNVIKQAEADGILVDKRDEMPRCGAWPTRSPSDILGVCIHQNAGGSDPHVTATYHTSPNNHITPGKPLPSICYHIAVTDSDEPAWLVADPLWRTYAQGSPSPGDENLHLLSIVVMGNFDGPGHQGKQAAPTLRQMRALDAAVLWVERVFAFTDSGMFGHYHFGKAACVSGDTEIPLLNGRKRTAKELAMDDTPNWFYSISPDGVIVPGGPSLVVKTGRKRLVEVKLDNGKSLRVTPDHLFMLRDGSYKAAGDLATGVSLMPLYRCLLDGYELCHLPLDGKWYPTHKLIARSVFGVDYPARFLADNGTRAIVHHASFDKRNNEPGLLELLTDEQHFAIHSEMGHYYMTKNWEDPDFRERARMRSEEYWTPEMRNAFAKASVERWASPAFRQAVVEARRAYMKRRWEDPEYRKAQLPGQLERLQALREDPEVQERRLTRLRVAVAARPHSLAERVASAARLRERWRDPEFRARMQAKIRETNVRRNHTVASVKSVLRADVYDVLDCGPFSNFGTCAGVFIHNCPGYAIQEWIEARRKGWPNYRAPLQWQLALLRWDAHCLPRYGADGDWGDESKVALSAFQRAHHLKVTAVRDPFTELVLHMRYPVGD